MDDAVLALHMGGLPKHAKIRHCPPPKPAHPESMEIPGLQHLPAEAPNNHAGGLPPMRSNWSWMPAHH